MSHGRKVGIDFLTEISGSQRAEYIFFVHETLLLFQVLIYLYRYLFPKTIDLKHFGIF